MRFVRHGWSLRSLMLLVALAAMELAIWTFLHRESYRQISYLDSWSEATIQQVFLVLLIPIPAFVLFWTIPLRAPTSGKNRANDGSILQAREPTPGT